MITKEMQNKGFEICITNGNQTVQCYRIRQNAYNEHQITGTDFVEMMGSDPKSLAKTSVKQTVETVPTPISVRMLFKSLSKKNWPGRVKPNFLNPCG